jgi:hypothetical protein
MIKIFASLIVLQFLSGCVHLIEPKYTPSRDNIRALQDYKDIKVKALPFEQIKNFDISCRGLGDIKPADNLTVAQFITKAFNDEFKLANIYSEDGKNIFAKITKIEVSSTEGLFGGFWDIEILASGHNGTNIRVNHKHEFETAYLADKACDRTASALTNAVQGLINATITHPKFRSLL